jgi:hypothetical protein
MAQGEDLAQAAARLEAALDRIAVATARSRESAVGQSDAEPQPGMAHEVAARLDSLIAQLRDALSGTGGTPRSP